MQLTPFEKEFLICTLKKTLRETEEYTKSNPNTIEAYLAENESIPMLKKIIAKLS